MYQYDIIPEIECEYRKGRYINKKDFGTWWCGLAKRAEEAALAYGGVADNDPEVCCPVRATCADLEPAHGPRSSITRDCAPSLLILQGIVLPPF